MKKLNPDGSRYIHSWETAKRAFRKRKPENETLINAETIYSIKQKPDEDVADYVTKKENLLTEIKPSLPEEFIVSQIVQGLRTDLYDRIMNSSIDEPIKTVDDLINRAIPLEQLVRSLKQRDPQYGTRKHNKKVDFINETSTDSQEIDKMQDMSNHLKDIKRMLSSNYYNQGQSRYPRNNWQRNNYAPRNQTLNSPTTDIVPNTQQLAIEPSQNTHDRTNVQRDTEGRPQCFNCKEYGHFARQCRRRRQSRRSFSPAPVQGNESAGTR